MKTFFKKLSRIIYDADGEISLPRTLSLGSWISCVVACFLSVAINSSSTAPEVLLGLFTASGGMYGIKKFTERGMQVVENMGDNKEE